MSNRLPVLAEEIRKAHDDVRAAARFSAERALKAGHLLIEAKAALAHGKWLPWLKTNLDMSERTAQGYMRLARAGLKSETVADLGLRATLTAVGRRKVPDLSLPAGRLIRLQAGKPIKVRPPDLFGVDQSDGGREHDVFLWSPDGKMALKLHFQFDPDGSEACWDTSAWKKPVDVEKVPLILSVEGVSLEGGKVATVRDFSDCPVVDGFNKIEMFHNFMQNVINVTLYGDDETLWPEHAQAAHRARWFALDKPTALLPEA